LDFPAMTVRVLVHLFIDSTSGSAIRAERRWCSADS